MPYDTQDITPGWISEVFSPKQGVYTLRKGWLRKGSLISFHRRIDRCLHSLRLVGIISLDFKPRECASTSPGTPYIPVYTWYYCTYLVCPIAQHAYSRIRLSAISMSARCLPLCGDHHPGTIHQGGFGRRECHREGDADNDCRSFHQDERRLQEFKN